MKKTILLIVMTLLPTLVLAQSDSLKLMGPCMTDDLRKAPYAEWFTESYDAYTPNPDVLDRLKGENLEGMLITIFFGSWCGDSKREVPRFIKLLKTLSLPEDQYKIIAIGNDEPLYRSAPGHEEAGKHIYRVPTFIITRDDEELGRIVEFPATSLERDLLDIVQESTYIPNYPAYLILGEWLDAGILNDSNVSINGLANQIRYLTTTANELNSIANTLSHREKAEPQIISTILRINCELYPNIYWTHTKLAESLSNNENKHEEAIEVLQSGMEKIKDSADLSRMQELLEKIVEKM
ncbi:MAG: thioredoxin family protein [Tannerellaceae bacterium]|jgi:thiol-disulfide isomerase/thioredoxin|nr:thioredoxin family protein [Tannerellaceae bacterium]